MSHRRPIAAVLLPAMTAILLTGCTAAPPASPVAPAHWAYEGEAGPAHWGDLDPAYATCASGREQSPVDIVDTTDDDLPNITFDYRPAPLRILNTGHTVQVNYEPGSSITVEEDRYELLQFHFHAPSEHHVEGRPADAELHLVHRSEEGHLAVVGVLLVAGADNEALGTVFENLPTEVGTEQAPGAQVDAADMLPANRTTYRYDGSLTTPPCTEGVAWLLMTEPVQVGAGQLSAFTELVEGNNRPLQPLNDRDVVQDLTP